MTQIMNPPPLPELTKSSSVASPADWRQRLAEITEMMREMSLQDDPQAMVRRYSERVRNLMPSDGWLSLSRRGLEAPWYRITRSSLWAEAIDPWRQKDACHS